LLFFFFDSQKFHHSSGRKTAQARMVCLPWRLLNPLVGARSVAVVEYGL